MKMKAFSKIRDQRSNLSTRNMMILFLAVIGFVITGIIAFPYGINFDAAGVFANIHATGSAHCSDWIGWYFPTFWEYLYRLTKFDYIMGLYVHILYWISITLLFFSVFDRNKVSWMFFIPFAFFPPSLLFIGNISNNVLLFVTFLLGISLFFRYKQVQKRYLLWISCFFLFQCIFIRREAVLFMMPLFACILFYEFIRQDSLKKRLFISCLISISVIVLPLLIEKAITKNLPDYHDIHSLSHTALYDLTCMSYYKGECLIPVSARHSQLTDEDCMKVLKSIDKNIYLHDYRLKPYWEKLGCKWMVSDIKITEMIPLYLKNFRYYLKHRARYVFNFLTSQFHLYGSPENVFGYVPRTASRFWQNLDGVWNMLGPSEIVYMFYLVFLYFVLFFRRYLYYDKPWEKNFMLVLSLCLIWGGCIIFLSSPTIQIRYIAPYFCLLYYCCFISFCKTVCNMNDVMQEHLKNS